MALSREERKLLHQKATQPTFGNNKPDDKQGNDGDVSYRRVEGSGLVQFVKKDGKWNAVGSTGDKPASRVLGLSSTSSSGGVSSHGSLTGLNADNHKQYLLVSGSRAMSGNLNMGTNDIGSVGALDVDGHTTLDQVTVNTTDGAFAVSGANPITMTTTGSNDIDIVSNQKLDVDITSDYELNVGGDCNWGISGNTDYRSTGTWTLTSVDNLTIETNGASTAKTILLFNDNDHASSFNGIHLKTDSGGTASVENSIFIECDGRAAKGGGEGVDIRSEDGILIRAENPNSGVANNIQIRATEHIDLAGNSSSITPTGDTIKRTKIHGVAEIVQLYRASGSQITTNLSTITSPFGGSPQTGHTEFEAINTYHLLRAMTYKTSNSSLSAGNYLGIVDGDNDDNIEGTVWRIAIYWNHGTSNPNFQLWHCFATTSSNLSVVNDVQVLSSGAGGTVTWESGAAGASDPKGIKWTNNHSSSNADVKASALKIQSGNDF